MITELKKLPMGIEDFKRIRTDNFYYIDKTGLDRKSTRLNSSHRP